MTKSSRLFRRAKLALVALFLLPVAVAAAAPDSPTASSGIPWQGWLFVGLAAFGGVETILRGLRSVLGVIAPRTKTTADDRVRDFVARLDDQTLDVLRALLRMVPPETAATAPQIAPPVLGSKSGTGALLMLALLLSGAALQPACATTHPRVTSGVKAVLDCETPHLVAVALDGFELATQAILSTISGDGHPDAAALKAALGAIKSDGLRCAATGAIAALLAPTPARPDAPAAAGLEVDAAELRAAFAAVRAEWGVESVRVAGQVL